MAQDLVDRGLEDQAHASGDLREAIRCYERAIELDPSLVRAHYQLVATHAALGQADDAASIYERRLAEAHDDVIAWCRERGYVDDIDWPAQELARLRSEPDA